MRGGVNGEAGLARRRGALGEADRGGGGRDPWVASGSSACDVSGDRGGDRRGVEPVASAIAGRDGGEESARRVHSPAGWGATSVRPVWWEADWAGTSEAAGGGAGGGGRGGGAGGRGPRPPRGGRFSPPPRGRGWGRGG